MLDRDKAKQLVDEIADGFGYCSPADWQALQAGNERVLRRFQERMAKLRAIAGGSVRTLANNVYGSDARFVFELLQNADDNSFARTKSRGLYPFVNFDLRPDRMIVECNEDGFEEKNLKAICSIGQSSKTNSYGYIGHKGIGFKSVFMVARKAHIESGEFSFRFEIGTRADGLGMITPIWTDLPATAPSHPGTRMTLYLHSDDDLEFKDHNRHTIVQQLEFLEPTCLLFLKNLKQMNIIIWDVKGKTNRSKTFNLDELPNGTVRLKTTTTSSHDAAQESFKIYRKISRIFDGLPINEERAQKNSAAANTEDRSNKDRETVTEKLERSAEVVLAFPLTEDGIPLKKRQQLFAFLPMRNSDYNFIIHTDFETDASRQNIVTTSLRNQALRGHIASTFIDAINDFCSEDSVLRFHWPTFLPTIGQTNNDFWNGLDEEIKGLLSRTPVALSRNKQERRAISEVVRLASDFIDEEGSPLLDDVANDPFLSPLYPSGAIQKLQEYGLKMMTVSLAEQLTQSDLGSSLSKIKAPETSEDWHSRLSRFFTRKDISSSGDIFSSLRKLDLIPLENGRWARVSDGAVYLPSTKGIAIPEGLPLRIIGSTAVANPDRKALFTKLNTTEPTLSDVIQAIVELYSLRDGKYIVTRPQSLAHLRYLYQARHSPECCQVPGFLHRFSMAIKKLWLFSGSNYAVFPDSLDLYLPGNGDYGPESLLTKSSSAPGLDVYILDPIYLQDPPVTLGKVSWRRWLCDELGIRERLRIVDRSGRSLSSIWNYVAESRPKKLLPMFHHSWTAVASSFTNNEHSEVLRKQVMNTPATKLCQVEGLPACILSETFLPKTVLLKAFNRFTVHGQRFPFLDVEDADLPQWDFLCERFCFKREADLEFLTSILSWIKHDNSSNLGKEAHWRLLKLYVAIRAQCVGDGYGYYTRLRIRTDFEEGQLLYIPASGSRSARWSPPSRCRLEAPAGMITKDSVFLETAPSDVPKGDLTTFYKDFLGISGVSIDDLLDELSKLHSFDVDFDHVLDIYRRLHEMTKGKSENNLNQQFELHQMIYIDRRQRCWYRPSECLWTSTTKISGKVVLSDQSDHYKDLRDFFIKSVGVRLLTLRMVYDELIHSSNGKTADELKSTIRSLNALLLTDNESLDPEPLLQQPIFAVRHGNGSFEKVSVATDFAIPDREDLASHFRNKVTMLDYSLEEIIRLRPFLEWAGLTTRYLSVSVKENTSVVDGGARGILRSDRDLKRKAHALLRIAATFNSPRWQTDQPGLYEAFRNTKVLETDDISSVLTLRQNGQAFEVVLNAGDMHIDDKQNNLVIYVPRSRKAQDVCFSSALPGNLATWLMQHPRTLVVEPLDKELILVLTSCLSNSRSAVDILLERHRIISVAIPNEDEESGDEGTVKDGDSMIDEGRKTTRRSAAESEVTNSLANLSLEDLHSVTPSRSLDTVDDLHPSPDTSLKAERTSSRDSQLSPDTVTSRAVSSFRSRSSQQPFHSRPFVFRANGRNADVQSYAPGVPVSTSPVRLQLAEDGEDTQYRRMLERVVDCARKAAFPDTGVFAFTSMASALQGIFPLEQYDGFENTGVFRSDSQLERNRKVGAAGELYVYEVLSNLSRPLRGWGRGNWQSRIRDKVKCHANYHDLEAWTDSETADLVYKDTHGDLADLLCDKGYLDHIPEERRRMTGIEYLIEVKTTTGACNTPFYMSAGQYNLMRNAHSVNSKQRYLVARVFGVNSSDIDMKVYVDPERLRLSGDLVFSERTFSVVPRPL